MKTKEFIRKMDDVAGAAIDLPGTGIHIYNFDGKKVGWVSIDEFGVVDTSYTALDTMQHKEETIKLMFEYALTPLSEREDEKKFRVRMLPGVVNCDAYLNQYKRSKDIFLSGPDETNEIQAIFTKSEYDKLQQKYHDWLPRLNENDSHFEFLEEK